MKGKYIGNTDVDLDVLRPNLRAIISRALRYHVEISYPQDVIVGENPSNGDSYDGEVELINLEKEEIPDGYTVLDIGDQTCQWAGFLLSDATCAIWCGSLGKAECEQFRTGSSSVAESITSNSEIKSYIFGKKCVQIALSVADGLTYTGLFPHKSAEAYMGCGYIPSISNLSEKQEPDLIESPKKNEEEGEEN